MRLLSMAFHESGMSVCQVGRLTYVVPKVRQIQIAPPNANQYNHIIATIAFDTHQELLWVGDDYVIL